MNNEFKEYLENARESFQKHIEIMKPTLYSKDRVCMENIILAYDKMFELLKQYEKQMIMIYTNAELLDMVERYKVESKIPIGNDVKLGFALFARWLLSQNLQQTPCTTLRQLLSTKVDEIDEVRELKEKQGLQTGIETGIVLGLKIAFQLIEDSQSVA